MPNTCSYKLCIQSSLQIMMDQRKELIDRCLSYNVMLYSGLHETDTTIRTLYYQYTIIDWLDFHWANLQTLLEQHQEFTIDQKKQITLFFAKYFSKMMDGVEYNNAYSSLSSIDLFRSQKIILNDLIKTGERWEENCRKLRLEMKKNKGKLSQLINNYEKEQREES